MSSLSEDISCSCQSGWGVLSLHSTLIMSQSWSYYSISSLYPLICYKLIKGRECTLCILYMYVCIHTIYTQILYICIYIYYMCVYSVYAICIICVVYIYITCILYSMVYVYYMHSVYLHGLYVYSIHYTIMYTCYV